MRIKFNEQYLGGVAEYKNYPQLEHKLSYDEINDIVSRHDTATDGSATLALVCGDEVYYFTQCPAKFAMAQICHLYIGYAPQLTMVGNYEGEFNVYKTSYLRKIYFGAGKDTFGKPLDDLLIDFANEEYIPTFDCKLRPYWDLAQDILAFIKDYGFSGNEDIRSPNIRQAENGDIILVDPIWVDIPRYKSGDYNDDYGVFGYQPNIGK